MKSLISVLLHTIFLTVPCYSWAVNSDNEFDVTTIEYNIYGVISPHYGLPTKDNMGWNANSYFIETESGILVIDTGSSEKIGNRLIDTIKHLTNKPIRWVINTHSHADHWLGNAAFAKLNAQIIATSQVDKLMKADGQDVIEVFNKMTEGESGMSDIAYPTQLIDNPQKLSFSNLEVEFLLSNNGHSPGDILIWLPQQKIIIGGDVLSSQWLPIITHHGDLNNLINTLHRVLELQPNTVLTGHGTPTDVSSIERDLQFLIQIKEMAKQAYLDSVETKDLIEQVRQSLKNQYQNRYRDFDTGLPYLVEMIYKTIES